jgi:terminase small subunit / prophage DNA-packing protein
VRTTKGIPRGTALNRTQIAALIGVSGTTVDAWIRKGAPVLKRSTGRGAGANSWQIDSAALIAWLREQSASNATGPASRIDEARRRKTAAAAELLELQVSERRGELVELTAVTDLWARAINNCRARLLSMPAKLAAIFATQQDPGVIRERLDSEIRRALMELSSDQNVERIIEGFDDGNAPGVLAPPAR